MSSRVSLADTTRSLQRYLSGARVGHALLLTGPAYGSLQALALQASGVLLGLTPAPSSLEASHPDWHTVSPEGPTRTIPVDSIRRFMQQLWASCHSAPAKVGLIWQADRLHPAAANAFLKTLEEPPQHTYLVLVTTRPHVLLPTLRSRCIQVYVPADAASGPHPQWQAWLQAFQDWASGLLVGSSTRSQATLELLRLVQQFGALLPLQTALAAQPQDSDPLGPPPPGQSPDRGLEACFCDIIRCLASLIDPAKPQTLHVTEWIDQLETQALLAQFNVQPEIILENTALFMLARHSPS
jgi:hypothetical protein